MHLTSQEEARLQETLAGIESRAGVQVLAVLAGKADAYPEAPWKAFALAASLAALVLTGQAFLEPPWFVPLHAAVFALAVLGAGAAAALLAVMAPPFARRFVTSERCATEVEQYARALFFEHRLSRTHGRVGILLLVSLFERKVVLLPDAGVATRIPAGAPTQIVARMTPHLARGRRYAALAAGLAELERELLAAGFRGAPGTPDEIRAELIQEEGAGE